MVMAWMFGDPKSGQEHGRPTSFLQTTGKEYHKPQHQHAKTTNHVSSYKEETAAQRQMASSLACRVPGRAAQASCFPQAEGSFARPG